MLIIGPVGTYLISFSPGSAKTIKAECKQSTFQKKEKKVSQFLNLGCNGDLVTDDCSGDGSGSIPFCDKVDYYFYYYYFLYCINQAKYDQDAKLWSCKSTHVLWAFSKNEASPTPFKCEKLNFKVSASNMLFFPNDAIQSDTITIPRENPTAKESISCFSSIVSVNKTEV